MHLVKYNSVLMLLIIFIAGALSVFAFAPFNKSYCIVVSILLLLYVIDNFDHLIKNKSSFMCGWGYGLAYFALQLYWIYFTLYKIVDAGLIVSIFAYIVFVSYLASYIGLAIVVYNYCKSKSKIFNFVLLFPSVWVFFEWLRGWLLSGFSWCDISYSQVQTQFLKGFFAVGGSYLVSWLCLSLIGAGYILALSGIKCFFNRTLKLDNKITIIYCLIIILCGKYFVQIHYTKPSGKRFSVALIQGNVAQSLKWFNDDFLKVYKTEIAKTKADMVIIPETAISSFSDELPDGYLDELIKLAQLNKASLIIGIPKVIDDKENYVNAAVVLTNPNQPYYAKSHLVPYGEYIPAKWLLGKAYSFINLPMVNFSAGPRNQPPLSVINQKLAFNICYENGFNTDLISSTKNSTIMINLSDMIWFGNTIARDQHLQLSQARALENQRYFLQDTNSGLTAIITPDGNIQSKLQPDIKARLFGLVQGYSGTTPFERVGNIPITLWCLIIVILQILIKFVPNKVQILKRIFCVVKNSKSYS